MGNIWALQDAKNRLSELVDRAATEGPQTITRHGKEAAILLSVAEFRKLAAPKGQGSLVDFFRRSPLAAANLDLTREADPGREIEL